MSNFGLKSVAELAELQFHVPNYQRGYRWKKQQVLQLLEDINSFRPTEKHPFYFLQALVVAKKEEENCYNVVDGQQRLTTLSLITGELKISYDRSDKSSIDNFYKEEASNLINGFFKPEQEIKAFRKKVMEKCCFLYYEVSADKELQTFGELNSGKIAAKDSELVKCLLLSPGADEPFPITQERAKEWDTIERQMGDDAFFAFMTPRNTWRENDRMTVLLRYAGFSDRDSNEVFPFLKKIQNEITDKSRQTVWEKICAAYYRLLGYFNDPLMYHAFGWYVHKKGDKKTKNLDPQEVYKSLTGLKYKQNEQGDDYCCGQNDDLHIYLFLHNVAFCWQRWPMRYDFIRHRRVDSWSLEHIFARNQEDLKEDVLKKWIPGITEGDADIKSYKEACEKHTGDDWLANRLGEKYPKDTDNSIRNLAMLPKDANSSFNNGLFEGKRQQVIEWAEASWKDYWIPPATEAVFLKSLPGLSMTQPFWSTDDKKAYVAHIESAVKKFKEALTNRFTNLNNTEAE